MSERPNLFDMGVGIDINDGVTRPGSPLAAAAAAADGRLRNFNFKRTSRERMTETGYPHGAREKNTVPPLGVESKSPLIFSQGNSRHTGACGRIVVQRWRPITVVESDTGPHGYGLSGRVVQRHFDTAWYDSRSSGQAWNELYRNAGS